MLKRSFHDKFIVRYKHSVGVIIATVEPLLNITFNRIHANDVGREIEIMQKVVAVRVPREVEIAHGDVRTAGAEHGIAVSKARGADLPILKGEASAFP